MRHMLLCLLDVLDERLDEIVQPLEKSSVVSPTYSDLRNAEELLKKKLSPDLHCEYENLLSMMRSYAYEEQRLCYLNGFQDHCKLAAGKLDILSLLGCHKP